MTSKKEGGCAWHSRPLLLHNAIQLAS